MSEFGKGIGQGVGCAGGGCLAVAAIAVVIVAAGVMVGWQGPSDRSEAVPGYHCAAALVAAQRLRAIPDDAAMTTTDDKVLEGHRRQCAPIASGIAYQLSYDALCEAMEPNCTALVSVVREDGKILWVRKNRS